MGRGHENKNRAALECLARQFFFVGGATQVSCVNRGLSMNLDAYSRWCAAVTALM